ncbi:MAG: Cof-type HAD-IIB family hydrolase [Acidimicrobiaceae bacterium]|nr:Cof-type HAD-IIB family hydrolase [Acidimicrobiaceae bacterium]
MKDYSQKPVRLIGIDLDGTLLNQMGQISKANIKAIDKANRYQIAGIASTARSIKSVRQIAAMAGLGPLAVCQNGAAIYDLDNDRLIAHTPIEQDMAISIISKLREQIPGIIFAVEKLDRFVPEHDFFAISVPDLFEDPIDDVLTEVDQPVTKIICKHPKLSHQELSEVAQAHCGNLVTTTSAGRDWVDFQSLGISKASGLAAVSRILGIDQSESAAIGDQSNDVSMLVWANYSAATANANDEAKAAANWLAPSNTENGVAAFIHHLIEKFNS